MITKKCKLFDELIEGTDAMQQREGKIILRSHEGVDTKHRFAIDEGLKHQTW